MNYPNMSDPLLANAVIASIAGQRVYRTRAEDSPPGPYVVWEVTMTPLNSLGDVPESDDYRVRVNCYALSQSDSRKLVTAAIDVAEQYGYVVFGPTEQAEDDTKLYRNFFDFTGLQQR